MSILRVIAKWLDRMVAATAVVLLIASLIVTSAGVFWRYLLNDSISWSEELGRFLLVWISFLGAAMAAYRGSHIAINFVFERLPHGMQLWLSRTVDILIIVFLGALAVSGTKMLPLMHGRIAPTLLIPMDIPYLIMPVSTTIFAFHVLVRMLTDSGTRKKD